VTEPDCPDETELLALAQGTLVGGDRTRVIEHLDGCAACRAAVAGAATEVDQQPEADGGAIGRYTLVRPIGAGAMGIVFEARDPELDRSVAIKLLRRQLGSDDEPRPEPRLGGEARSLAKLAHPNVVAAYEVARHDGDLYLVMELVEGPTLAGWLDAAPRSTREVLAMFQQAGQGLAAAHAAGIVHRDFKLDNVLVGADGRARVTDFGLASGTLSRPPAELDSRIVALTRTGALAGTPAFMAPEVLRGGGASAASDQFAFAVSLWIGLYGVRPFEGATVAELIADSDRGQPRTSGRRVDKGVRAIVERGLAPDPAHRWPSVSAMLTALERTSTSPTRRRYVAGVAVLAIAGTVGIATTRTGVERTCPVVEADMLWDPSVAQSVQASIARVDPARASLVTQAVGTAIEAWRQRWRAARTEACALGGSVGELRGACLDLMRLQPETMVRQLATNADPALVESAIDASRRLPDPRSCVGTVRSTGDGTLPALLLDRRLAEARALHKLGRFPAARDIAAAVRTEAAAQQLNGVELRATLLLAESQSDSGQRKDALATFDRTITLAVAADDDKVLAEALVHLVSVYAAGADMSGHELANTLATAALERAGNDPELVAMLAHGRCRAGWRRPSEPERGKRNCDEAERQWRALRGDDAAELGWVENQRGLLAHVTNHFDEAITHFLAFEKISLRSHGPTYSNIDVARVNAADAMIKLGRMAQAEPILRDLVTRRDWGSAYNGLGQALLARGAYDEAIAAFRSASAAGKKNGFPEDDCQGQMGVADVLAVRGDRAGSVAQLAAAVKFCTERGVADTEALAAGVRAHWPAR